MDTRKTRLMKRLAWLCLCLSAVAYSPPAFAKASNNETNRDNQRITGLLNQALDSDDATEVAAAVIELCLIAGDSVDAPLGAVVVARVVNHDQQQMPDKVIGSLSPELARPDTELWKALVLARDQAPAWKSRADAAGLLALQGDTASLDFLIQAYDEPKVLLPAEEVKEHVGDAIARVTHPKATAFLINQIDDAEIVEPLHWMQIMLDHNNPDAAKIARRMIKTTGDHDLIAIRRFIQAFQVFGKESDIALIQRFMTERYLANFAEEDRAELSASMAELKKTLRQAPDQ